MDARSKINRLSQELSLSYEPQDWGIINSDEDRVLDFIDYFDAQDKDDRQINYQLTELIIASYNDAMIERSTTSDLDREFQLFVEKNKNTVGSDAVFQYWRGLNSSEFPVSLVITSKIDE